MIEYKAIHIQDPNNAIVAQYDPTGDTIYINSNGPFDNPSRWTIYGMTYDYLSSYNQSLPNFKSLSSKDLQELVILHELGHKLGVLEADDIASDPFGDISAGNSAMILSKCFSEKAKN